MKASPKNCSNQAQGTPAFSTGNVITNHCARHWEDPTSAKALESPADEQYRKKVLRREYDDKRTQRE
jgi:hypothetical protein